MADLVTLEQAKKNLRITWDDEDDYIQIVLDGAESAVLDYLKGERNWNASTVPKNVVLAILVLTSTYFDSFRDGDNFDDKVAMGYLPPAVTALLHRLRKPAYAFGMSLTTT